jgi:hypothetical protein
MNFLSELARLLGKASVYTRDANAVARGRLLERLANRAMGRVVSRGMRRLWR